MNPSRFWRAAEFACKSARSVITGRDAPTLPLPGPMDDGDLLATAEAEYDVFEPLEAKAKQPCTHSWGDLKLDSHSDIATCKCGVEFLLKAFGHITDTPSPFSFPLTPAVSATAAVESAPAEVPPASAGADSEPDWKTLFQNGGGRIMAIPEPEIGVLVPPTVTRVVLVHGNHPDRSVTEKWAQEWDVHIQDDGRTLKLFSKNPTGPRYEQTPGFFDLPDVGGPW